MRTSPLQFMTTIGLSICLGGALMVAGLSQDAVGYPAGAAVSSGSNPVVSMTGTLEGSDSASVLSVPADQAMILTDVIFTAQDGGQHCRGSMSLTLSDGTADVGHFGVGMTPSGYTSYEPTLVAQLSSGIRLDPGSTLSISSAQLYEGSCTDNRFTVNYVFSGYYAQP